MTSEMLVLRHTPPLPGILFPLDCCCSSGWRQAKAPCILRWPCLVPQRLPQLGQGSTIYDLHQNRYLLCCATEMPSYAWFPDISPCCSQAHPQVHSGHSGFGTCSLAVLAHQAHWDWSTLRSWACVGDTKVLHIPTMSQFADIFTKGLWGSIFNEFRSSLNVSSAALWLRGRVR
jgi:hypothetical protein